MTRYFIETAKYGVTEGGMACGPMFGPVIAEVKVKVDNGEDFYMSLAEVDGIPCFYKTPESTYDFQVAMEMDDDKIEELNECAIWPCDYEELFEKEAYGEEKLEFYQLYRYLVYLVRADWDDCETFAENTQGKYLDEIVIPASDIEEKNTFVIPGNQEELFKLRLGLEAEVELESVFHDMDADLFEYEQKYLKVIIKECDEVCGYDEWKDAYIADELKKYNEKEFLVCNYVFAGIGQYKAIILKGELDNFKRWIMGSGSAFLGGVDEANEEDIKRYIALETLR